MVDDLTPYEALMLAVERAGSQAELARLCGVSATAVWKWVQSGKRVGHGYALVVEEATGVSRHVLRPDLYPVEHSRFLGVDRRAPHWVGLDLGAGLDQCSTRVAFKNLSTLQQRDVA